MAWPWLKQNCVYAFANFKHCTLQNVSNGDAIVVPRPSGNLGEPTIGVVAVVEGHYEQLGILGTLGLYSTVKEFGNYSNTTSVV